MKSLDAAAVRSAYEGEFRTRLQESFWPTWRTNYIAHVERVQAATDAEWMTPAFQETLWDNDSISGVGPGSSVTVAGAYKNKALARALRDAFLTNPLPTPEERGLFLQKLYDDTLDQVQQYNDRRPKARLTRLLAALFPTDISCILGRRRFHQVLRLLNLPTSRAGVIASHPVLRAYIQSTVGEAASLAEQVEQSIFTWFLWERFVGGDATEGAIVTGGSSKLATNIPMLALMPANSQRRGLTHVSDNIPLLVAIVRECEQGISRTDLVNTIQREAPHLKSAGSASGIISQAQGGLTLIKFSDGAFKPTERGLELLASPDPSEVLQPLLVGRVFGIGHLLLALKEKPEGMNQKELSDYLLTLMPNRKSQWASAELIQWVLATKLVKRDRYKIELTEDGIGYAEALPEDFKERWTLAAPSELEDTATPLDEASPPEEVSWATPTLDLVRTHLAAQPSQLILPEGFLAQLHAALHASSRKRFVLLAGLSGTGKTSIARAYSQAYCSALGLSDWRDRYAQVAVRPDWTDPSGLLGYVNAITDPPSFQGAETLRLILAADADRSRPYFLCLDEMNLARVEHYFAPFLSAMEGDAADLALHGQSEAIDNVDPRIAWPTNLFIFGTVNMDESTYPFSDKVLDRAFTFEFWDVDLKSWADAKKASGASETLLNEVASLLQSLYDCLYPARRHFGYRSADEILHYCEACSDTLPIAEALDSAVLMKILPRVRGDDSGPLSDALTKLHATLSQAALPRSVAKVAQMQASLHRMGQARFWS